VKYLSSAWDYINTFGEGNFSYFRAIGKRLKRFGSAPGFFAGVESRSMLGLIVYLAFSSPHPTLSRQATGEVKTLSAGLISSNSIKICETNQYFLRLSQT
jgi:hypothetical protein